MPLLFLLLVVLSTLHAAGLEDFVVSAQTGGLGRAWIAALAFHVNLLEARRGYLPGNWDVLWSLSIEEMFYLFFPLLCRLAGRGKGLAAVLAVFVVLGPFGRTVLAHGNDTWQEYSYLGGMDAIALGCLTALLMARVQLMGRTRRILGGLGVASLTFIRGFSLRSEAWGLDDCGLNMTLAALGTCMIIAAAARTHWRSPRIAAPMLMLGRYSYEIYLTHMFVVFALYDAFVAVGSPLRAVPALFVGVVVAAGLLGVLVARGYSEPLNRLLRNHWGEGAATQGSVVGVERPE